MINLILYIEGSGITLRRIMRETGGTPPLYMINRILERVKKEIENSFSDYDKHSEVHTTDTK